MSYRDDLDALAARHAALEHELTAKTKELDAASRLLDEARTRARRPVLDNIRVATPCRADWSQMTGDDRVRACGECNKNVYNLSELTREEAEALIVAHDGKLCVRYYQRTDGTILLADCQVGIAAKRKRRIVAAGAAALLAGGGGLAYKLLHRTDPTVTMGAVGGPEPTAPIVEHVSTHETAPPQPRPTAHVDPVLEFHPKMGAIAIRHLDD